MAVMMNDRCVRVDASQSDAFVVVVVVMRDDEPRARIETYVYRPNVHDAGARRRGPPARAGG